MSNDDLEQRVDDLIATTNVVPFEKLEVARERLDVSVALMAATIGASRQTYYQWRHGRFKPAFRYHLAAERVIRKLVKAVEQRLWPCDNILKLRGAAQVQAFRAFLDQPSLK